MSTDSLTTDQSDRSEAHSGLPNSIERANIVSPPLSPGDTCIVVQRHEEYDRTGGSDRLGSLTPEGEEREWELAHTYFDTLLAGLPREQREQVHVSFTASDSDYEGQEGSGERAYETAVVAQQAAEAVFERYGLPKDRITNTVQGARGGYADLDSRVREPQIFTDSPEYVAFLRERHPGFTGMMDAYEDDRYASTRTEMKAEGPNELADRVGQSISELAAQAQAQHAARPDRIDVVWVATHYDTVSPYVKRDILGVGIQLRLPVEYGGGFAINVDSAGNAATRIAGRVYPVKLASNSE